MVNLYLNTVELSVDKIKFSFNSKHIFRVYSCNYIKLNEVFLVSLQLFKIIFREVIVMQSCYFNGKISLHTIY